MRAVWPGDAAVGAADLSSRRCVAWLLYRLGPRSLGAPVGATSAAALPAALESRVYAARRHPSAGAVRDVHRGWPSPAALAAPAVATAATSAVHRSFAAAGMLFGLAFVFKYNAGVYASPACSRLWLWRR